MTFLELAKARYSVRSFKDLPIQEEHMSRILEAGHVAPTACNNQPQKIYIAKSEDARKKLASVCRCTFDAPVILVVCYDRTRDWKNKLQPGYESGETDAAIVCTYMMLEAADTFVSETEIGKSEFSYNKIALLAETDRYFVFLFSASHAQIYDKKQSVRWICECVQGIHNRKDGQINFFC